MKRLILIILINFFANFLFADPTNPKAIRGNISIMSSEYKIKKEIDYWQWNERLDKDLSDYYKKIE